MTDNENINKLEYPNLLSKFKLAGKSLKNRIIHSAMSTRYAQDGLPTKKLIDYHVNRAKGGAAVTIVEPLAMRRNQASNSRVRVFDQKNLDSLKLWADSVNKYDCHILAQIQEPGRGHHKSGRKLMALSASSLPDDLSWSVPYKMTISDIKIMIDDFVFSSIKLKKSGFSGVEISAGHGHIFHQFLSSWSNNRDDDYGGSIENRTRLLRELIYHLRSECGNDFIIGLRLPGNDYLNGSIDLDESIMITQSFTKDNNIDFFCWVQGGHNRFLEMHLPDMHLPRGTYLDLIKSLRGHTKNIPAAAVGRILEPVQAETLISDGTAELVMLGRALVTDPAWGNKAYQNRDNDIRKCVSCNNCWGVINLEQPIQCDNNPRLGMENEVDWFPEITKSKKKIVVVGGGIAGLEAAWVASARGNEVTLFSSSSELGGKIKLNASLPGCDALSSIYDYQKVMLQKTKVNVKYNWYAGVDDIVNCKPDAVILATGGSMIWPKFFKKEWFEEGIIFDLRNTILNTLSYSKKQSGKAVIFDADGLDGTYSSAEYLSKLFEKVVIITERESIAKDEPLVRTQSIYRRMYEQQIEIITYSIPSHSSNFEEGNFVYKNIITGKENTINKVALFTFSSQRIPDNKLEEPLVNLGLKVYKVGDCLSSSSAMIATKDGHSIGNLI
ncbi:NAD-binding protein [Alphaproteobacteria bacterium]|nr:NAD-binding protein [Alphaproteobacteria bacterium]